MGNGRWWLAALVVAIGICASACTSGSPRSSGSGEVGAGRVRAGSVDYDQMSRDARTAVEGKILAYVPAGMGQPLADEWATRLADGARRNGMTFQMQDPNWDATRQAQVTQSVVDRLPAGNVLVVWNLNRQVLAKILQDAEGKGIYVIQLGQESNYKTDAIVMGDSVAEGAMAATDVIAACGAGTATSHKISIVQGDPTSSFDLNMHRGFTDQLRRDPSIQIVSDQAAAVWDRQKAHDITATVVQRNPDLCAYWGMWDVVDIGGAQAIKEAGLVGKVKVFSSDQSTVACDSLRNGLFTEVTAASRARQADASVDMATTLLQMGLPPGSTRVVKFTPLVRITKNEADLPGMCYSGSGRYGD